MFSNCRLLLKSKSTQAFCPAYSVSGCQKPRMGPQFSHRQPPSTTLCPIVGHAGGLSPAAVSGLPAFICTSTLLFASMRKLDCGVGTSGAQLGFTACTRVCGSAMVLAATL